MVGVVGEGLKGFMEVSKGFVEGFGGVFGCGGNRNRGGNVVGGGVKFKYFFVGYVCWKDFGWGDEVGV